MSTVVSAESYLTLSPLFHSLRSQCPSASLLQHLSLHRLCHKVACIQCSQSKTNNKKESTEIYSSLNLNHHHGEQQQHHHRHSLLHVWHHRRHTNTKAHKEATVPGLCWQLVMVSPNTKDKVSFWTFWGECCTPRVWSRFKGNGNNREETWGDWWPLTSAAFAPTGSGKWIDFKLNHTSAAPHMDNSCSR